MSLVMIWTLAVSQGLGNGTSGEESECSSDCNSVHPPTPANSQFVMSVLDLHEKFKCRNSRLLSRGVHYIPWEHKNNFYNSDINPL